MGTAARNGADISSAVVALGIWNVTMATIMDDLLPGVVDPGRRRRVLVLRGVERRGRHAIHPTTGAPSPVLSSPQPMLSSVHVSTRTPVFTSFACAVAP